MNGYGVTCDKLISPKFVALPHEEVEAIPQIYYSCCAYIYLDTTRHFLRPILGQDRSRWDEMWGTLLHEMVHAYLRVSINPHYRNFEWTDPQGIHGRHSQRCIRAINAHAEELGLGIGGVFQEEWAEPVEGCWLDEYGTAWPCESEIEDKEDSVRDRMFPPSTAATSPSLRATHASGLEPTSEYGRAVGVVPSTDRATAALDLSHTSPAETVAKCEDAVVKSEHTLADSIHAYP